MWLTGTWLAGLNGFVRRSAGLALPDPAPGDATAGAPLLTGESEAYGVEASLRRVAGRATLSLAYSYVHAAAEAAGRRFPAATDRPHAVDATGLVRLWGGLRLRGAFGYASGTPYTRATLTEAAEPGDPLRWVLGEPNSLRAPAYRRLDVLLDWSHRFERWSVGAYLKLPNLLNDRNVTWYRGAVCTTPGDAPCSADRVPHDILYTPADVKGNLGLRLTF